MAIERNVGTYVQGLLEGVWEEAPPYFITSSSNGTGRDEVLDYIEAINSQFFKATKN
jgi:GTP-binding protein